MLLPERISQRVSHTIQFALSLSLPYVLRRAPIYLPFRPGYGQGGEYIVAYSLAQSLNSLAKCIPLQEQSFTMVGVKFSYILGINLVLIISEIDDF